MPSIRRVSPVLLAFVCACGSSSPPPAAAPPAPSAAASTPPAETASAAPSASAAPAPAAPVDEKKAAQERELQEDRARWETEYKAEQARWTPELHAAAKALADKTYASGDAAVAAALKGPQRKPGDAQRDKYRHPEKTLAFFGFKPTMTVLDVGPGEGWYSEILAPALNAKGHYEATSPDPNGPAAARDTFYGQRFKQFLETAPEVYGKVETVVVDPKAPKLGKDDSVDMVLVMRGLHGMENNGTLSANLEEIHRVLKPGGVLGIEEHRAAAGADPAESAKKGYLPEKWVIAQIEEAGFKLAGKAEINANPKDTKDYAEGVWTLPPTLRLGDKDRDKYLAIGESDRMTLKFVKVAPKPAAKDAATKPAAKDPAASTAKPGAKAP